MDDIKYWVGLSSNYKIGARTLLKLHQYFGDLKKVLTADQDTLKRAMLDSGQIQQVVETVKTVDFDYQSEKLRKLKIGFCRIVDANYPELLKQISDPPAVLYYRGELKHYEKTIAVVGSRKYSPYGKQAVEQLVGELCQNQMTVVSGLALGIDALAHFQTLKNKGKTIAVLGCGLDQIYPISNTGLADKIIQGGGLIVSEFPPGTPALKFNFPLRNRIIAGLSLGTLVVEGALESGSLLTAKAALEYDREVFAVPGSIFMQTSEGPNKLIQMGAKLVTSAKDIVTELGLDLQSENADVWIVPDSKDEENMLKLLLTPASVDQITRELKIDASLANSMLTMLEIKGMVKNLGGTQYVINGRLESEKRKA